jgi:biotin carboxylase
MELVLDKLHTMYYSVREVPEDLKKAGFKLIELFKIKGKFFHFEFFRTKKSGELVPLELNLRPPGGLTVDMFNYACDIDIFQKWAEVIVGEDAHFDYERKYFCAYISLRNQYQYQHSIDEILNLYGDKIIFHTPINSVFREAIGDYGFIVRVKEEKELFTIKNFIHATV